MPRFKVERVARGAAIPEYAIALTALVLAVVVGIRGLEAASRNEVRNQADCVSTRPPPPPVTDGSGDVVSGCQLRAVNATTTTVLTPTTPPATGTTQPPPVAEAAWESPLVTGTATAWSAEVLFSLRSDGSPPTPVEGAELRVTITVSGSPQVFFQTCTTDPAGRCAITFDVPFVDATEVTFHIGDGDLTVPFESGYETGPLPGDVVFTAPPPDPPA